MAQFELEEVVQQAKIKVIGVGGAGGNAVNTMITNKVEGVEFYTANTDVQALKLNAAPHKLQIGAKLTKGLGAGADPNIGRQAALEDTDKLIEALDVGVPLLAFLFLVALGVDYNIFLVTRAREEALGFGSREGMLRALTATGGVITSAGVLLAAVFAVLGVLPLVVLAQLGAIICIGVLLDTLVVRTVLVPALALRLGDRFWWPRFPGADRSAPTDAPVREPALDRG